MTGKLLAGKHMLLHEEVRPWFDRNGKSYTEVRARQSLHRSLWCSSISFNLSLSIWVKCSRLLHIHCLLSSTCPPQNAIVDLFSLPLTRSSTLSQLALRRKLGDYTKPHEDLQRLFYLEVAIIYSLIDSFIFFQTVNIKVMCARFWDTMASK